MEAEKYIYTVETYPREVQRFHALKSPMLPEGMERDDIIQVTRLRRWDGEGCTRLAFFKRDGETCLYAAVFRGTFIVPKAKEQKTTETEDGQITLFDGEE